MATTVDRAMAKAAAALLPGLLPTPPRSTMIAVIILPSDFPKPGRADSVQQWDAHKNAKIEPCSPASPNGSSTSSSSSKSCSGRADSVERWDTHKKKERCSGSPGSSSSSRWESSSISVRAKWDGSKRPPSRASSADRWDVHKKHRLTEADGAEEIKQPQDNETSTMMVETAAQTDHPIFSGSSFIASPDPNVLPMPAFFPSRGAGLASCANLVMAH